MEIFVDIKACPQCYRTGQGFFKSPGEQESQAGSLGTGSTDQLSHSGKGKAWRSLALVAIWGLLQKPHIFDAL